ncbi:MAG: putative glycoside hydrolase [Patescibacteria group bacterium]
MSPRHHLIIILIFSFFAIGLIYFSWSSATKAIEDSIDAVELTLPIANDKKTKLVARTVKGIYITAYTAGNAKKLNALIELIDKTELNAVVVDIKDYSGKVLYDSVLPIVNDLRTKDVRIRDAVALTKKLREHNIYSIARQTVFQDPILAENKNEWAIRNKSGGVWRDNLGLAWVDPTQKKVWDYNIEIAKEAVALGFDEINFDYVRFPSDGDMRQVKYASSTNKNEVMKQFFHYLDEQMKTEPVWISLDMFGFVMERHDGLNIGQKLADAVDSADYISPMMYPSHYPKNHLGFANPAEHPAEIIDNGARLGMPNFIGHRAKFRPWIQAFNLGAKYDAAKIRAQIDTVEKYTDAGWLMWNAGNKYTDAGLKVE